MVPVGTIVYALGSPPVIGVGVTWTADETKTALTGTVAGMVYDDVGTSNLQRLLISIPETGFTAANVQLALSRPSAIEDWQVGEAIAEAYLTHQRACHFPWPDGRDIRKRGSSLPGADLVGFQADGPDHRFAFGEVKTSSEATYPPGASYGETGFKQQLEDLQGDLGIRDQLVMYLAHRAAPGPSWKPQFEKAAVRYLSTRAMFASLVSW